MRLYDDLTPFYHLLDPLEDHEDECEAYGGALRDAVPAARSLLELGCGAGNGAYFIKRVFEEVVLSDLSEPMLARSREHNPDCEHVLGDMRTLRLGRTFDCVLIHDAITYMTTRSDLEACLRTAWDHLKPGGAVLLVPDCLKESFVEAHEDHAADDALRSLRCLSWSWDPDPTDDTHVVEFAFMLRENGAVRVVHEQHVHGLFTQADWMDLCKTVGFEVSVLRRPLEAEELGLGYTEVMFLGRRPE